MGIGYFGGLSRFVNGLAGVNAHALPAVRLLTVGDPMGWLSDTVLFHVTTGLCCLCLLGHRTSVRLSSDQRDVRVHSTITITSLSSFPNYTTRIFSKIIQY